jgi:hypothetical protein
VLLVEIRQQRPAAGADADHAGSVAMRTACGHAHIRDDEDNVKL